MKFGEVIKELKIYPNKKFVNDNGVIMRRVENEIKYAAVNQSESDITLFGSGWWNSDWKEVKEKDEWFLDIRYSIGIDEVRRLKQKLEEDDWKIYRELSIDARPIREQMRDFMLTCHKRRNERFGI